MDRELQPEPTEEPAPPAEPVAEESARKEPPQEAAPKSAPLSGTDFEREEEPSQEAAPKSARELWARRMTAAEQERAAEAGEDMPEEPDEEPEESRFLSLEELVGTTVGAVMEEHQEPLLKPRRGLFSRKRQQVDTEQFYDPVDAPCRPPSQ